MVVGELLDLVIARLPFSVPLFANPCHGTLVKDTGFSLSGKLTRELTPKRAHLDKQSTARCPLLAEICSFRP
jgi:hypothetical protein